MITGGSGAGQEFRKHDNNFYSGIVVKTNDPLKLNRVKVFIPELSNQPFDDWLDKFDTLIFKAIGSDANPKTSDSSKQGKIGDWSNTDTFEKICDGIPWAEPLYPIMGESGNFRYNNNTADHIHESTISDANYIPLTEEKTYPPSYWYEREDSRVGDAFKKPAENSTPMVNPYAFSYNSFEYPNKAKGLFGIPEVGSKVWVFHYNGNVNFPIYFGVRRDYRELALVNDTDNPEQISNQYPSDFENGSKGIPTNLANPIPTTAPPTIQTSDPVSVPVAAPETGTPITEPSDEIPLLPPLEELPEGGGTDPGGVLPPPPEQTPTELGF